MKTFKSMLFIALFFVSYGLVSCGEENPSPPAPKGLHQHFLFINQVDMKSDYLGTFSDLTQETVDNKNTHEFGWGTYPFVYKNTILIAEGVWGDKIYKFTRNEKGELLSEGHLSFGQDSRPGEIAFVDEKTAFVSLSQRGKIGIFNPVTMRETGEIDLSAYAIQDNNPDPGCNVMRDGKLYVALNQKNSLHTSWPGTGAEVAIINTQNKTVEKVIKDDRTTHVGLFRHSTAFQDERGDLYFYSDGMEGMNPLKDGFLRIKKGTDEWDQEYYFQPSHTKVEGLNEAATWILPSLYVGEGVLYACINVPAQTKHADLMQSSILDHNYQPVKINVWNKSIEKLNLPMTTSMGAFAIAKYKEFIVFGMTCKDGVGYYTYNTTTGDCSQSPVVTTVGIPSSLIAFEE